MMRGPRGRRLSRLDPGAKTPLRRPAHVGDTMAIAYRAVGKPAHERTETEREALVSLRKRMAEAARWATT